MPNTKIEVHGFLSGVILAAGASSRMGQPKQLLAFGDRGLLQHVVDAAAGSCLDEIIVVLGHRAQDIGAALTLPASRSVRIVLNPGYAEGQSTSLRVGVGSAYAQADAAAILLGDQPGVTSELIDRVAAAFLAADLPIARPVYVGCGRIPGHPVFLARRIWPEVEQLHGDQGARALLCVHPEWLLEVPAEGEPPTDLDTREDYQRAVARPGSESLLSAVRRRAWRRSSQ